MKKILMILLLSYFMLPAMAQVSQIPMFDCYGFISAGGLNSQEVSASGGTVGLACQLSWTLLNRLTDYQVDIVAFMTNWLRACGCDWLEFIGFDSTSQWNYYDILVFRVLPNNTGCMRFAIFEAAEYHSASPYAQYAIIGQNK